MPRRGFIDQSLERLKTDVIDLLQIHSASMEVLERGETLGAMQAAQRAGKVRHIGMTGGVAECVRALELGDYETVQFPYNLLNLAAEDRLLALAREKNAGVIIMRGIAGGKLSAKFENLKDDLKEAEGRYWRFHEVRRPGGKARDLVHLSLGYLLSRPEVSSVIIGTRHLENVRSKPTPMPRRRCCRRICWPKHATTPCRYAGASGNRENSKRRLSPHGSEGAPTDDALEDRKQPGARQQKLKKMPSHAAHWQVQMVKRLRRWPPALGRSPF